MKQKDKKIVSMKSKGYFKKSLQRKSKAICELPMVKCNNGS